MYELRKFLVFVYEINRINIIILNTFSFNEIRRVRVFFKLLEDFAVRPSIKIKDW